MPLDETLSRAFLAAVGQPAPTPEQRAFLDRAFEDYRDGELPGLDAGQLGASWGALWRFAADHGGPAAAARLVQSGGCDVLEIVQPDAPFLVDSVMAELAEAGAAVRAMFHPLVGADGERRSIIQVWLDPVGEERRGPLVAGVLAALADVRLAVADSAAVHALMAASIAEFGSHAARDADAEEAAAFLGWLLSGRFVFLGARVYDYPRTADGGYAAEEPLHRPAASLGVLRDEGRAVLRRANEPAILSAALRRQLEIAAPVVVAKSNLRSRVHRRVFMDYVGVRRFGADGRPAGETRFVGLFTLEAYEQPPREIPLLRRKVARVLERAGFSAGSHNGARLANILETYPRDELFQIDEDALLETALGILHLIDRPRVKLFARADPFDRFVSVLLYAPRERYDGRLRSRAGEILSRAYGGWVSAYYPSYSDAPLARVHFIIGVTPGDHPAPDLAVVEAAIARAARTWGDDLEAAIRAGSGDPAATPDLIAAYADAFPPGYRDRYDAAEGLIDLRAVEALGGDDSIAVRAFRRADDSAQRFRFKLYRSGEAPAHLARVTPILRDMGLSALVEDGFAVTPRSPTGARRCVWVHEFLLEDEHGDHLAFEDIKAPFEAAFAAVWDGRAESDGFNRLVLELGAGWREAALVRALARFRLQSGLDPSQAVQQAALASHPGVARLILGLFAARLDPALDLGLNVRRQRAEAMRESIETALRSVESLDFDRVLRRLAALVGAITRTNYYQRTAGGASKPYISFKVASRELADLPAPRPFREIFVASPIVEGAHLRMGPVARGGLRWSDRRDDFRTEVLGLVKAQQVKNAVIVPVGSKGGFYPKRLPRGGPAGAIRAEAIGAYEVFLSGMLDLTDSLDASGAIVHPGGLVIHDEDDPYLVVAADKGTASFSDIANQVAERYGFWLGDAFASGGSAGYDHKAMAITARGAWEAIQRHFRERGRDIEWEPTTVVGVGDMSGDVFGNGMLLSKALRLQGAFDHRHIFLDPDPDPAASWTERRRLFELAGSSWDDYDRAVISAGGGVWPRSLKSVPLGAAVKALLGVRDDELPPDGLIKAMLRARVDLLYLGGIGTYVKAAAETDLDVGDKANDGARVDGGELRCAVVGEGANLGFTQAGRIEYAKAGGRIDTDAIDNSAGVDTSDHEVNIKILTGLAMRAGELSLAERDGLLASMTGEVAAHVLADTYDQSLVLTLMEAQAAADLEAHGALMLDLEARGRLDRGLEGLPAPAALNERAKLGLGLTRPELAVLLAYGKLDLFDDLIASGAPDDPALVATLKGYFPRGLGRFSAEMERHPLRREIIATVVGNSMVNLCGPTFPGRLRAAAGCDTRALTAAFEAAHQVLRLEESWRAVERLDGKIPASAQTALFTELSCVLRGQTYWLARRAMRETLGVGALALAYRPGVDSLRRLAPAVLSPHERAAAVRRARTWVKAGAPKALSHAIALMRPLTAASGLIDLARERGWPLANAAFVYHRVGGAFGFDRLRAAAASRVGGDVYERLAMRRLIEDMLAEQAALAGAVMIHAATPRDRPERDVAAVAAWTAAHAERVRITRGTIEGIDKAGGGWTFAKLTIANAALRDLASAAPLAP